MIKTKKTTIWRQGIGLSSGLPIAPLFVCPVKFE